MRRRTLAHTGIKHAERHAILFLTVCAKDRGQWFANEGFHSALIEAWQKSPEYRVGRYVVMPDHIHFFCSPNSEEDSRLGRWVTKFKGLTSNQWADKPNRKIWQVDFWDTQMRSQANYLAKLEYVYENPVRARLVKTANEWPFQGSIESLHWD